MTYSLFIDDERFPPGSGAGASRNWKIARSMKEVVETVRRHGSPEFISFDHDLGEGEPSGKSILNAMVSADMNGESEFPFRFSPGFSYAVHSQNPIGANAISGLLDAYLQHKFGQRQKGGT